MALDLLFYYKHEEFFLGVISGWLEAELQHLVCSPGLRPTWGVMANLLSSPSVCSAGVSPLGRRSHCLHSACMNLLRSVDELVRIKKPAECQ